MQVEGAVRAGPLRLHQVVARRLVGAQDHVDALAQVQVEAAHLHRLHVVAAVEREQDVVEDGGDGERERKEALRRLSVEAEGVGAERAAQSGQYCLAAGRAAFLVAPRPCETGAAVVPPRAVAATREALPPRRRAAVATWP